MVRSLWSAATGMIAQQNNVDTIANNLANVNTTGYKTETNEFKSLLYQTLQTKTTTANGDEKPVSAQVGLGGRRAADVHRLVGLPHVRRGAVGVAEHRHRAIAEPARGAHHAAGDLAAVGDQDLGKAHAATAHDGARR